MLICSKLTAEFRAESYRFNRAPKITWFRQLEHVQRLVQWECTLRTVGLYTLCTVGLHTLYSGIVHTLYSGIVHSVQWDCTHFVQRHCTLCRRYCSHLFAIPPTRDGGEADVVLLDDGGVQRVKVQEQDILVVETCNKTGQLQYTAPHSGSPGATGQAKVEPPS